MTLFILEATHMGYKKGIEILPAELIKQIQEYVDGELIYIPRIPYNRRRWGEKTNSLKSFAKRNEEIYTKYKNGVSVMKLSEEFYISPQGIYKIISKYKD